MLLLSGCLAQASSCNVCRAADGISGYEQFDSPVFLAAAGVFVRSYSKCVAEPFRGYRFCRNTLSYKIVPDCPCAIFRKRLIHCAVYCPAFWRDCPQDICEIFRTKDFGSLQIAKRRLDFKRATLASHLGFSIGGRRQGRAGKINFSGSAIVPIVYCLHAAADHCYLVSMRNSDRLDDDGRSRIGLGNCAQAEDTSDC